MIKLNAAPDTGGFDRVKSLSGRIGWICQSVRVAAAAYAIWLLYALVAYWSSVDAINNGYGRMLEKDLSGMEAWQQAAAFALHMVIWALAAFACYSAWRLFTLYLRGSIFSLDSALWLRRIAFYGALSEILDIVTRPLISVILTMHYPAGQQMRIVKVFFLPNDLVLLILLFGLLALAHIQKTAAEIAEENAQIV
jgi:hypothetical protein